MSLPTRNTQAERTLPTPFQFDTIEDATRAIANGEFVVVMDDESRENEGDLICAAEKVTTEGMAWMIKWTRYIPLSQYYSKLTKQVDSFAPQYPLNDWNNSAYLPSYHHLGHRKIRKEQHTTLPSMLLR
jgi:hypothetical protein